jgi:hypothetical protein
MKRRQESEEDKYQTKRRHLLNHMKTSLKRSFPAPEDLPSKRCRTLTSMISDLKVESEKSTPEASSSESESKKDDLPSILQQRDGDIREAFELLSSYLLESQRLVSKRLYEEWNAKTSHFNPSVFSQANSNVLHDYEHHLECSRDGVRKVQLLLNRFGAMIDEDSQITQDILSLFPSSTGVSGST